MNSGVGRIVNIFEDAYFRGQERESKIEKMGWVDMAERRCECRAVQLSSDMTCPLVFEVCYLQWKIRAIPSDLKPKQRRTGEKNTKKS